MKITCISAANIEAARSTSASVKTCELVRDLALIQVPDAEIEVVPLLDYEMVPCRMCGRCHETERCTRDSAFNQVFEKMIGADALFMVVPHYAPLPSKMMILCEKMEEIAYLNWCANQGYRFPLTGKPVGIIGHGGQQTSDEVLSYYQRMVVEPVAMAMASVSMQVISAGEGLPRGAAFGIQSIAQRPGSIFVDITHDWVDIQARISSLVQNVVKVAATAATAASASSAAVN